MFNDKIKELIEQSRIVSFSSWQDRYPSEVIEIFQQADDEKRYLTDGDLERLQELVPSLASSLTAGKLLRDHVTEIVAQARTEVLAAYPNITQPGGELYPPMRAEACWRDFWHFLRCITYGISGESLDYTSDRGLSYMKQLYRELHVPLPAMILGLEKLKFYGLQLFETSQQSCLAPYFARLIAIMKGFS
ncbi:MAG: phycobilisome protein [Pleurocapsa sp.]